MRLQRRIPLVAAILLTAAATASAAEIHTAVQRGDLKKVKSIIEKDKSQVDAPYNRSGYTPLYYAVSGNKLEIAKYLISKKADVNKQGRYGYSPLQMAAMYGREKMIDAMLATKPKLNVSGRYYTPLTYAIQSNQLKIAEKLLKAGADVNAGGPQNYTPLHAACNYGRPNLIAFLLKQKGIQVDKAQNGGYTPLYYLLQRGDTKNAKLLLDKGADPKQRMKNNYYPTILHACAQNGQAAAVKLLLAKKVEVNVANNQGETPLHFAARMGNYYRYGYGQVPRSTQDRYGSVVEALLEAGANANLKNKAKQTPLQLAVMRNAYVAVNHLLPKTDEVKEIKPITGESMFHWCCKHGLDKALAMYMEKTTVDVKKKNSEGQTPLVIACNGKSTGHAGVVTLLLKAGADVNQKLDTGETVMHVAAWNGNAGMIAALLKAKGNLNVTDKSGYTPLHLAAWNGHTEAVKTLLKAGAKADAKVEGGTTPLHAAAWKGHTGIVQALIAAKANVSVKDSDGLTPLHKAAWNGHVAVAQELITAGADVNAKDNDGYTPTVKAREQKKAGMVSFLKSKGGVDSAKK